LLVKKNNVLDYVLSHFNYKKKKKVCTIFTTVFPIILFSFSCEQRHKVLVLIWKGIPSPSTKLCPASLESLLLHQSLPLRQALLPQALLPPRRAAAPARPSPTLSWLSLLPSVLPLLRFKICPFVACINTVYLVVINQYKFISLMTRASSRRPRRLHLGPRRAKD